MNSILLLIIICLAVGYLKYLSVKFNKTAKKADKEMDRMEEYFKRAFGPHINRTTEDK